MKKKNAIKSVLVFLLFSLTQVLFNSNTGTHVYAQQSDVVQDNWNLLKTSFKDGSIGHSGVIINKNSDGSIRAFGTALQTDIKDLGDIILDSGEYVFKGLSNQDKNTVALQLWSLDDNNCIDINLVPQIGYYEAQSFCVEKSVSAKIRIIVYSGASIDITFIPIIERKKDSILSYHISNERINGIAFKTISDNVISINGLSTKTFIKQIADIQINPGEYTLSGLFGLQKNTVALQLWYLDEKNNPSSLVCSHVGGDFSHISFTVNKLTKIRLRFIVYSGSDVAICCFPTISCNLKYPRIEGNLIDFINIKGEIGKSGTFLSVQQNNTISVTGVSSTIGVRVFGTATLYPGLYCYSGLDGMKKNSIALQLWEVDEIGKEISTICPQIGTTERNQMQFTITKKTNVVCRIIVYAGVLTNISCSPSIAQIRSSECDFQSINSIDDKVNILIMEEGYQTYTIYRSANNQLNFEKIGSQKEPVFYDTSILSNINYSYYYVGDGVVKSKIRNSDYNSKECTSVACLMYHYFMTEDDLNNGGLTNSYVYVEEFENDLKYLTSHNINTIFCSDLIAFLKGENTLPGHCAMIVIDDGHYSVLKYALPLLKKYNCKANATIIGEFADRSIFRTERPQSNYWMSWDEIGELSNSGYFEIGSHTYYLHNNSDRIGAHKKNNETNEEYHEVLYNDGVLINKKLFDSTNKKCCFFAYPYNNPSQIGVDYMYDDFGYQLFFVGDANYWDYTKTRCNIFVKGTQNIKPWYLIRRASRRTGEDFATLLNDVFENQNSQY